MKNMGRGRGRGRGKGSGLEGAKEVVKRKTKPVSVYQKIIKCVIELMNPCRVQILKWTPFPQAPVVYVDSYGLDFEMLRIVTEMMGSCVPFVTWMSLKVYQQALFFGLTAINVAHGSTMFVILGITPSQNNTYVLLARNSCFFSWFLFFYMNHNTFNNLPWYKNSLKIF